MKCLVNYGFLNFEGAQSFACMKSPIVINSVGFASRPAARMRAFATAAWQSIFHATGLKTMDCFARARNDDVGRAGAQTGDAGFVFDLARIGATA
jgi:hypothetical protein